MQRTVNFSKKYISNYSDLPRGCWQSIFLTFIASSATGVCFFLSLYFVNVLKISIVASGFLISSYGIGTVLGSFISGKLSDHLSAKKISTINLLMQSIAFFLLTQIQNEIMLLIDMFFIGFCSYGFITSNNIWMLKECHNQIEIRLKSINIRRAASNLGMGVSGFIIGFLSLYQFHGLFYLLSATFIFSTIYLHWFVNDTPMQICITEPNSDKFSSMTEQNKEKKKILFLILKCVFLINLIIAQLGITYPIYIQHLFPQMGINAVSILFVLDTILIVLFQVPLINCLKGLNKIVLVGIGAFLMGFGMYVLNFSSLFYGAIISCLIWTTGEMIFIGMAQFVCYESGADMKKGQTMGMYQTITAVSRIIGPITGGYIYYTMGGHVLWSISMVIGFYCLLMCLCFRKYDFIEC